MNFITELYIVSALQIIIAIGLLNVWLVRFHKPTKYRGAGAGNMEQELGVLMIGAISMHAKVRDNIVRTIPAILMLLMSVGIIMINM